MASRPLVTLNASLFASARSVAKNESSFTAAHKHLLLSRRNTSPTAIGRMPPAGFRTATSAAPAKYGAAAAS
eukprot:9103251-Alexandrium_andersonii.AAC.1